MSYHPTHLFLSSFCLSVCPPPFLSPQPLPSPFLPILPTHSDKSGQCNETSRCRAVSTKQLLLPRRIKRRKSERKPPPPRRNHKHLRRDTRFPSRQASTTASAKHNCTTDVQRTQQRDPYKKGKGTGKGGKRRVVIQSCKINTHLEENANNQSRESWSTSGSEIRRLLHYTATPLPLPSPTSFRPRPRSPSLDTQVTQT